MLKTHIYFCADGSIEIFETSIVAAIMQGCRNLLAGLMPELDQRGIGILQANARNQSAIVCFLSVGGASVRVEAIRVRIGTVTSPLGTSDAGLA